MDFEMNDKYDALLYWTKEYVPSRAEQTSTLNSEEETSTDPSNPIVSVGESLPDAKPHALAAGGEGFDLSVIAQKEIEALFPVLAYHETHYDKYITEYVLELYVYYRSLGLSMQEVAYELEMSSFLLSKLLHGEGLSLEVFVSLAQAELFSMAKLKGKLLKQLDIAGERGRIKASVALLEKIYPEQYSPKAVIETKDNTPKKLPEWKITVVDPDPALKPSKDEDEKPIAIPHKLKALP